MRTPGPVARTVTLKQRREATSAARRARRGTGGVPPRRPRADGASVWAEEVRAVARERQLQGAAAPASPRSRRWQPRLAPPRRAGEVRVAALDLDVPAL